VSTRRVPPCTLHYTTATISNPADIISRGCTPQQLYDDILWWSGPGWLKSQAIEWPTFDRAHFTATAIPEQKRTITAISSVTHHENFIINRFSSLSKLIKVIALIYRFIHNVKLHILDKNKGYQKKINWRNNSKGICEGSYCLN
jgi:hypothetical protein